MRGFTKLHSSLTASSIWNEPDAVRIVWITMLSMADGEGNVKASVVGLAHQARKTLPETEHALKVLAAPDPHSGRKEMEGRRITPIDGGWHLVTHGFYRETGMSEETKRYWREKKRNQRTKEIVKECPGHSRKYASASASSSVLKKGIVKGKGKPASIEEVKEYAKSLFVSDSDAEGFFDSQEAGGWRRNGKPLADWRASLRTWLRNGWLPSQKQPKNGQAPQMMPHQRQNRINKLNEKKAELFQRFPDPLNRPSGPEKELARIDAELKEL